MKVCSKHLNCLAVGVALALGTAGLATAATTHGNVTRATLDNGLRVVIVRNTLAPVVTTVVNYRVGANETAPGFPGTAHAMEHMMFHDHPGLTRQQLFAIGADMGGIYDAFTKPDVTQYLFNAPAQDLGVALHVAAIRMNGVDVTPKGWKNERGAIEQEVSRDMSNPIEKFGKQAHQLLFAGTPYAHLGLGTRPSFDKTTAARLTKFYDTWYAPNNATLVIAGDVDPASALKKVKSLFGSIASKKIPAKPTFHFQPVTAKTVKLTTDFPVGLVAVMWRMPGLRSKDYATALVLSKAMASKRGKLYSMGLTGKALAGRFNAGFLAHAGMGEAMGMFRPGGDAQKVLKNVRAIVAQTAAKGVPAALVKAAKTQALAELAFKKNSVRGLALSWSHALAIRGGHSPYDVRAAIEAVTPAEVNALAKKVFNPAHAVSAILTPKPSGKPISHAHFGGAESFSAKPTGPVTLPKWAQAAFAKVTLPPQVMHPTDFTLHNGLHVIVQPESVSKTVEVYGGVKTNADMQAPKGQKGVATVLDGMFRFGTTHMKRLQFEAALDAIGAKESAGTSFSLKVPSAHFAEGMKLLAANELHPALSQRMFMVMQHVVAGRTAGAIKSPKFLNQINMDRAMYPATFPGLRYATPKSVTGLTLADVKAYKKQVFRPDLTTIVVVGDVTPAQVRKVVKASFGSWKASGPKPVTDYPAVPANKLSQLHTPDSSATQDTVMMGETLPLNQNSPARHALVFGNQILGSGGFASHLMRDLRTKAGLVYGVRSGIKLQKNGAQMFIHFGCDPDKVAKARAMVIRDIKQMLAKPVSATDLRAAKGTVLRRLTVAQGSFATMGGALLKEAQEGKSLGAISKAERAYFHMTASQIQAAFKKYIRPNAFVTAVMGPAPK